MYVIVKQVVQFKYYWNDKKEKWEGLINNASVFGEDNYYQKIFELENRFKNEISYMKI